MHQRRRGGERKGLIPKQCQEARGGDEIGRALSDNAGEPGKGRAWLAFVNQLLGIIPLANEQLVSQAAIDGLCFGTSAIDPYAEPE